jgi:hypothetical protein
MLVAFRVLYSCAMVLSTIAGALVIASLFTADRAPQSGEFLGISLVVSAVFLAFGVLRGIAEWQTHGECC